MSGLGVLNKLKLIRVSLLNESNWSMIYYGHRYTCMTRNCLTSSIRITQCSTSSLASGYVFDHQRQRPVSNIDFNSSNSNHLTFTRNYRRRRRTSKYDSDNNDDDKDEDVSALFVPVDVPINTNNNPGETNIGEELGGSLKTKSAKGENTLLKTCCSVLEL